VCLLFDLAVFCLWFLLWGFVPNYEMGSSFNWRVVTVEFGNESFNSSKKKKKNFTRAINEILSNTKRATHKNIPNLCRNLSTWGKFDQFTIIT
jgi:hypothetical protein